MAWLKGKKKTGKHQGLGKADPYSYSMAYRRVTWMFRVTLGLLFASFLSNAFMASAIKNMMPLKEVQVALLRLDDAEHKIFLVEPISDQVQGFELLLEHKVRGFVPLLLEIDGTTQNERMGEARILMDVAFYNSFLKKRKAEIQQAIKDGKERRIKVTGVTLVRHYEQEPLYHYAVHFDQLDYQSGALLERKSLTAYLNLTLRPTETTAKEKFVNPEGVRFLDMTVKEKP